MWQAIIGFLGGPVIKGLLDAYNAKLKAGNTTEGHAVNLAAAEIAAQTQLRIAQIGHPFEPEKLAFYVVLLYFAKCVIWDTMLGLGTTGVLHGDVSLWAGLVMSFYFGKRTLENVIRIIRK